MADDHHGQECEDSRISALSILGDAASTKEIDDEDGERYR